jgi:hypothetical protein
MTVDNDGAVETRESLPEISPADRFAVAQAEFDVLLERDFPDFTVEQYAAEKASADGLDREKLSTKLWAETRAIPNRLDLSGDGKLGLDDVNLAAKQAMGHVGKAWKKVTAIGKDDVADAATSVRSAAAETGKKIAGFDYLGTAGRAARKTKDAARSVDADAFRSSGKTLAKVGKTASGIQGIQNRREAADIKQVSEEYLTAAELLTEQHRVELYAHIEEFGALRLDALHETLGRFLRILEALKQNNRVKEYELLDGIGIDTQTLESMGTLDMTVTESLRNTAATGALGLAAVLGTPALVTGAVGAFATASTGTAISGLTGAAYSNAVLAWLGGGSLAAGGGGMAAGSAVLVGVTVGATAGVTLLATGILVSTHYAKKLTEAKTYQKEVALAVASLENAWLVMDGILSRVDELTSVTQDLRERLVPLLTQLEAVVPTFDPAESQHAALFNKCGLLVKTMVELAQVPLLGDDGELTDESLTITTRVKKVLNTEV